MEMGKIKFGANDPDILTSIDNLMSTYRSYDEEGDGEEWDDEEGEDNVVRWQHNYGDKDLKEIVDWVVKNAVDEAICCFRYPTAFALQTLYDENHNDLEFLALIDRVFRQTADRKDPKYFAHMIIEHKPEAKPDSKPETSLKPKTEEDPEIEAKAGPKQEEQAEAEPELKGWWEEAEKLFGTGDGDE
ncbi:hypothetical protein B0T16DRAFT_392237 [Cercophora newfieldiana]|uniref:Uncharacterized protein n=1 Tax=Cercophora newfieldiana TaxID=92897 RepID=A0AA39Y275_9PEZI|nr:hypothetical protein B0T16DRAFT_392237 [Cercophora newfieldiana]